MILTIQEIQKIIIENQNKKLLEEASKKSRELRMHLYGENLSEVLGKIEGFEGDAVQKMRLKYTKSNKDVFQRLARPLDKVFSAKGGSFYYYLQGASEKQAVNLSMNIHNGYSLKKWIECFWKPHFLDDPMGFIFIEIDRDGNAYPTYKPVCGVYEYQTKGTALEYVIWKLSATEKKMYGFQETDNIFRVVDDAFDRFVKVASEIAYEIDGQTFPNYFLKVPAILNSDIVDPNNEGNFLSFFDDVIGLANDFLLKGSIKKTHDFLHGFPKYWEYADDCYTCQGTGEVSANKCTECKGTGKNIMTKVSDAKLLNYPSKDMDNADMIVTPNVAGYVSPDKTYYDIATSELAALEDEMWNTLYGKGNNLQKSQDTIKTATEVMDDFQPMADRLAFIAESAERRHKFILDLIIELKVKPGYSGSSINYGRRFQIETADSIMTRYSQERTAGSPISVLDQLLMEFIETKYSGDPVGMQVQLKLSRVEPFVHYTMEQMKELPVSSFEKLRKSYYGEWLNQKKDVEILVASEADLIADLTKYTIEQSTAGNEQKDDTPLAVKIGVGGTQSLQLILSDPLLTPESKANTIVILFGLKEEEAQRMVSGVKKVEVPLITPNPEPTPEPVTA